MLALRACLLATLTIVLLAAAPDANARSVSCAAARSQCVRACHGARACVAQCNLEREVCDVEEQLGRAAEFAALEGTRRRLDPRRDLIPGCGCGVGPLPRVRREE